MNKIIVVSIALISILGILFISGIEGMFVTVYLLILFELMHRRIYGKSISEISRDDYYDSAIHHDQKKP